MHFRMADGVRLVADQHEGRRPEPVVLLHGGSQTRHAWGDTTRALAHDGWTTIAVDLRGHGESDWSPTGDYNLETFATDVKAICAALERPPVLVGASLGGLSSMLALCDDAPSRAAALVLVDVAHRYERTGAERIVEFVQARPSGFESPQEAAEQVAAYLPHRPRPPDPGGLTKNLRRRGGKWRWHWDPALLAIADSLLDPSETETRTGWLTARLAKLALPTLLVRGELSDIVTEDIAAEFCRLVPGSAAVEIPAATHMVAGDSNDRFTEAIRRFFHELVETRALPHG